MFDDFGNNMGAQSVALSSELVKLTPTVSTTAYSANDVVGGKQTIGNAVRKSGGTGMLQSILVKDLSNQKAALEILIFDDDPSAGTYSNDAAFSLNATDEAKLIRRIPVAESDYVTIDNKAFADIAVNKTVKTASGRDLYAVIITTGTPTYSNAAHLKIHFSFLRD